MTHLSKRGVPTWQDQLAVSRQKKKETAARALKKEKYTVKFRAKPVMGSSIYNSGQVVWYVPFTPAETKWLSEEEATLWRLQGYIVTPYEKPPTPKWPVIDIEIT